MGRRQVGPCFPGLGLEAFLASLTVLAGGVVFTLALEVPIHQQALRGVEVTLAPERASEKMVSTRRMKCSRMECVWGVFKHHGPLSALTESPKIFKTFIRHT